MRGIPLVFFLGHWRTRMFISCAIIQHGNKYSSPMVHSDMVAPSVVALDSHDI